MSNERADEFLPWRGRLTPPDALPEQGLEEKELTWQRLAERLQKKPRRRFAAWWIAAACFVLAFLPASHLLRTGPAHPSRVALHPAALRPVALRPAARQSVTPLRNNPREPRAVAVPAPVVKTLPVAGHRTISVFATIKKALPDLLPSPVDSDRVARSGIARIVPPAPDTLLAAIAPPPPQAATRRQLRIVYLNELNKESGLTPALANRPPALRLGTAANTADWTTGLQNTSFIKIDLSSHNH